MDKKNNTKMTRNGYSIVMFQGGLPHEIDNRGQVLIGPSKKIVAIFVVGELEVLI